MTTQLAALLIDVVFFAVCGYGMWIVCMKFELPKPVLWICGAALLIVILLFMAGQIPGPSGLVLRR